MVEDGGRDDEPYEELTLELYAELRRIAGSWMRGQHAGHTLQATALAHEAWLKLARLEESWNDRGHFLATASRAMLQILVDHANARNAAKRKAPGEAMPMEEARLLVEVEDRVIDVLDMAALLGEIEDRDPAMRTFVEMRFFGGCTMKECAAALDVPERTLERRWHHLRLWLFGRMTG